MHFAVHEIGNQKSSLILPRSPFLVVELFSERYYTDGGGTRQRRPSSWTDGLLHFLI